MTTGRGSVRPSVSGWRGADKGSTRASRAQAWGCPLLLSSPRSTAARSTSAPRRSAACAPSWCCRRGRRLSLRPAWRRSLFRGRLLLPALPQLLARQPCALAQRLKLRPDDARVHLLAPREGGEAAV